MSTGMHTPPVIVTTDGLTVEDVIQVATARAEVRLDPAVEARVAAARAVVETAIAGEALIYGLNTGLGHMRDQRVSREQLMRYQTRIVASHASGIGAPLSDEDVRALMLARVAGIARGGSGAHPDALRMLVALLNAGIHPLVPAVGSVGAADLMHMAAVAMVMIGRGEARVGDETLPGAVALARAGMTPYVLQPKDGLSLLSANGAAIGLGALTVRRLERVAALADLAGALTLEAAGGNPSPFEAEVAAAKPIGGQIAAATHLRQLLDGSDRYDPDTPRSVQDALSLRVMPQVHGALREQIAAARQSVELELNAIDDNPLVSIAQQRMISNGNFQPMLLALHFEATRVGLAHVAMLSERRMHKIVWLRYGSADTALQTRLADPIHEPVTGLLAYSAAAILSELKSLAAPVTLGCPPLDLDMEDHATLAPLAVTTTRRALEHLETILTIEALLAIEALRARPTLPRLGAGTGAAYRAVTAALAATDPTASAAAIVEAIRQTLRGLPPG